MTGLRIGMLRVAGTTLAAVALGSMTGCSKSPPSGQVVARVGGEEITRRDVAAELAIPGLYPRGDESRRARLAIQSIIDRKLVAAEARKQELDRTPDFLAASQRGYELLLGTEIIDRWKGLIPQPSVKQVNAAIATQPHRFGDRAFVEVVQVTSPRNISRELLKGARTAGQIGRALSMQAIPFDVSQTVIDTARIDEAFSARLIAAQKGAPLVEQSRIGTTISAVAQVRPAPLSPTAQRAFATQLLIRDTVQQRILALRNGATITYQSGMRPPSTLVP